jgi:Zn-dependent alcohol dehydrogenase
MGTSARVVVLPEKSNVLRVEDIELPEPGPTQVEVRQFASGICHSQLHQIDWKRVNTLLLGHESTGIVNKVGEAVTHVKKGDIVLLTWVPRNPVAGETPPEGIVLEVSDGLARTNNVFTWADVTLADQQYVVKVDPGIARDVTAIVGCAVITGAGAAVNSANIQAGQSVAIFGVGGVGLCAVAAAKVAGANPIIAVDLDDQKLGFAKNFGATHGINASRENPVEAIHALTGKENAYTFAKAPVSGADVVLDCIGIPKTISQMLASCRKGQVSVRPGGVAVLVGLPVEKVELNGMDLILNEKSFIGSAAGSCKPDEDIPRFLDWHDKGQLDLDTLITQRYKLDDINEAVSALRSGEILGRAIIEF